MYSSRQMTVRRSHAIRNYPGSNVTVNILSDKSSPGKAGRDCAKVPQSASHPDAIDE
jgi:hypothetical protein